MVYNYCTKKSKFIFFATSIFILQLNHNHLHRGPRLWGYLWERAAPDSFVPPLTPQQPVSLSPCAGGLKGTLAAVSTETTLQRTRPKSRSHLSITLLASPLPPLNHRTYAFMQTKMMISL